MDSVQPHVAPASAFQLTSLLTAGDLPADYPQASVPDGISTPALPFQKQVWSACRVERRCRESDCAAWGACLLNPGL